MVKISTINTNNTDISKTETWVNTGNTDNIYSGINTMKARTTMVNVRKRGKSYQYYFEIYSNIIKNHIRPRLGFYRLSQITTSTLQ